MVARGPGSVVFVAVLLAAGFSACDSSTPAPPAPATADAGTDGGGAGARCALEPAQDGCATCCGYTKTVLNPYLRGYQACACDQACKTQCASSLCAATPTEPSAGCEECLNADETIFTCEPIGNDACDEDPSCSAFRSCDAVAQCLSKPGPESDAGP